MSRIVRELVEAILLAGLVFVLIQVSVQNFRVQGSSMNPTLEEGEYLMVNKLSYFRVDFQRVARLVPFWSVETETKKHLPFSHPPSRGDVIVFHAPTKPLGPFVKRVVGLPSERFVKRIVGLPGENVDIREGKVFINGTPLQLDPDTRVDCDPEDQICDWRLGDGEYIVLGDNRDQSQDSRAWGPVSIDNMVGEVWFVYWPLSKLPFLDFLDEEE